MTTILHQFYENVLKRADDICFMVKCSETGSWRDMSWSEVLVDVVSVCNGLRSMGLKRGDSAAIFSNTRFEWTIIDLAVMACGAKTVPIYHTLSQDHVEYIINHSSAKIVFVENVELFEKLNGIKDHLKTVEKIVSIEGADFSDMLNRSKDVKNFSKLIEGLKSDDVATCIYTSGTTGEPKGVEITHSNIMGEVQGLKEIFDFRHDEIGLLFLPLAHVIARAMQFYQLSRGCIAAYAESIEKLKENILEVRPHFMAVVPRIMEKIYERIQDRVQSSSFISRFLFNAGVDVGRKVSRNVRLHKPVSPLQGFKYWLGQKLVFSKLHKGMGGRLKMVISGGAPLSKPIAEFFHAAGILVIEGYGLTETMAAITINRPCDFKFGTVGKPLSGVQIRIAEDGEVLVMGPQVFQKYREPVADSDGECFDGGWFKTGDLGEFSRAGFLRLTGRKKEIIVTAGGKNISPSRVESIIKSSPYISDIVVFGDGRKYLSAVVTLDFVRLQDFVTRKGLKCSSQIDIANDSGIYQLIKTEIECRNRQLARHETIKRFFIIDHGFSQDGGELTPTLKHRRKKIFEKYRDVIEKMYDSSIKD